MAGTDVLQEARTLISNRITDLDDERKRLENALKELGGKVAKRKPGRPRGSKAAATSKASTGNGRRGRPQGGGSQLIKFLALAKTNPESDNQAIADHLGVKLSTATAMVSKVKSQGLVTRENKLLVVTKDGEALLNGQAEAGGDKSASVKTAKKASASKAKKAPAKKRAKAKKDGSKKATKSSSAKAAKTKTSSSSAAKAPAAPGDTAGASDGDKAGDKPGGDKDGNSPGNVLYDK
jgi:hypothetical protein